MKIKIQADSLVTNWSKKIICIKDLKHIYFPSSHSINAKMESKIFTAN